VIGPARGFRVSLLGLRLAVVADSAAIADVLDRYVLPWLPRAPIGGSTADRLVEVRHAAGGPGLEILVDDAEVATAPNPMAAIPAVQRALDEAVARGQTVFAMVHAGVVGHGGRAIILPGPSGSGKSTLVAELVRRGAQYFSDEYALIDAEGLVHPYPRPLLLRDESGEDKRPLLAAEMGGTVAGEPMPAALIVGLRHVPVAAPSLRATSQAEGMLLLLRNTPQALVDLPWILTPLARAVRGAACYVGLREEARDATAAILELASSVTCDARGRGACRSAAIRSGVSS